MNKNSVHSANSSRGRYDSTHKQEERLVFLDRNSTHLSFKALSVLMAELEQTEQTGYSPLENTAWHEHKLLTLL